MRYIFFLLCFFIPLLQFAQTERKTAFSVKVTSPPRIDGFLDDPAWNGAPVLNGFRQYLPKFNDSPCFPTEVKIVYDDQAIYVCAMMSDPFPDSIPMQLGNRDDENMNVDHFAIEFDTYDNQLDSYSFIVTSAGVQIDYRESDETYDAVWMSSARMTNDGWIAEVKIPYSALRFPKTEQQNWGLQLIRSVRRYREFDHWSLERPEAENRLVFWGALKGISNIELPVRLSLTPYLTIAGEHFPDETSRDYASSFGGGMDLKYGLNESYTLDMTLLPDFSQVQSDNKIKNLTAFETIYDEQRPFFSEAVDLFEKGDIFYSRRIGRTPERFYSASSFLNEGEKLVKNPVQQKLVNATKLSGRGKSGLAIGLMNAVTANTYAIAQDSSGNERQIMTDPSSNYNMLVFSQALKYNSEFYVSNASLLRSHSFENANITAAGITLNNKSNNYALNIHGGTSRLYTLNMRGKSTLTSDPGYKVFAGVGKKNGRFQFTLVKGAITDTYNANSMGVTLYNNFHYNYASISYNFFHPWWKLRDWHNSLSIENENHFTTGKVQKATLSLKSFGTTLNYLSLWLNTFYEFMSTFDYYEPRVDGWYYQEPAYFSGNFGFSSDYRKQFALDGIFYLAYTDEYGTFRSGANIHPIFRVNDHFLFNYIFSYDNTNNQVGYASHTSGNGSDSIRFGNRRVTTIVNTISGKYLFRNNLSLNINTRHYWAKGKYDKYFLLGMDGRIIEEPGYNGIHDFNFNVFTLDMVFSWIFAPGSSLNIVWKNAIDPPDGAIPVENFFSNLRNTFEYPQRNTVSLKVLYYLDYQQLRKKSTN